MSIQGDLAKMYPRGPAQLGARVSTDPALLNRQQFYDEHGMYPEDWAARAAAWERAAFEESATADLDQPVPGATPRARWAALHGLLAKETAKLAELQARRKQLDDLVNAPSAAESDLQALFRRAADRLVRGLPADASDARAAADAEARAAEARHLAESARLALPEIDHEIQIATLRVEHLRGRKAEYLNLCVIEAARPLLAAIAKKRAELAALEAAAKPLHSFVVYGDSAHVVEVPAATLGWKSSWGAIADAIEADPGADVSKMLPPLKF